MVVGGWSFVAVGGLQLSPTGWWRLVVVCWGWWMLNGCWWRWAMAGGWRFAAAGGRQQLVVGGWWRLTIGGPLGRCLRAFLNQKIMSLLNDFPADVSFFATINLGGPTRGAKNTPLAPFLLGLQKPFSVAMYVAPTVIGEGRRHRGPEVFEPGTVRILTVPSPFTEYASWKGDRSHGYKVLGLNNANSGGL